MPEPRTQPAYSSLLELAISAAPNGIVVCDEAGVIVFANQKMEAIFGYSAEELSGQTVDLLVPDEERDELAGHRAFFWRELDLRGLDAIRDVCGPHSGQRKDGSRVAVDVELRVAEDSGRRLIIASIVDLTARVESQNSLTQNSIEPQAFERLTADLTSGIAQAGPDQIPEVIVSSLGQIAEMLDVDCGTLWNVTSNPADARAAYTWIREEYRAVETQASAAEWLPAILAQLKRGEVVSFTRVDELANRLDRERLLQFGTRSGVALPVPVDGDSTAVLGFISIRTERKWTPEIIERLRLLAAVFGQALARNETEARLQNALGELRALKEQQAVESTRPRSEARPLVIPRHVVAESQAGRRVLAQIEPVASTSASVLLLGETGSGKDVFAQLIHDLSKRHHKPMVRVNCAAIPSTLIESELFGHERGAYTGALSRQIGRFELANESTIFLDEIGDLPLEAQVKLLRVLQDKVIERLGGTQTIKVDVRIIAATNRNLERAVQERTFREDLFYRLNVYPISVPALRERREDIPLLIREFVDEFSRAFGKRIESITEESMAALEEYGWPGNIRELRNVIERAVILATGPRISIEPPRAPLAASVPDGRPAGIGGIDAQHIRGVLERAGWRVRGRNGAAEVLGVKPTTLESRMAKLGIYRPSQSTARPRTAADGGSERTVIFRSN